ncbi:MAG TPA: tRNA guanosine(15) transglycosylase TgtA [Nitrososphaerales archaeon]|nr:tRNA guanosine(15) transglycosylase TgtA [Nitrososphaerales archaeon]
MDGGGITFEVKETDLLGRIGRLEVQGKRVETPYLFPVIHPVSQSIPPHELAAMGFRGLMTNSLILYQRRREEALEKGLHKLLGFDGLLMTDSGGYQVLEYGAVAVTYEEIAQFQAGIGSNLAVTLDRPTGDSTSKVRATETMEYSLRNAKATIERFGESRTVWVGPVQGGTFQDLLKRSAGEMVGAGFQLLALGSPVQIMENYRFRDLVAMISATRRAVPYSTPLHLFGAGHPLTMALSVALGCDTFDSASYVLFARQGRYMTERGTLRLEEMEYLPCSCVSCRGSTATEFKEMERSELTHALSLHNLFLLQKEMESCKEAIVEGRLWDLVGERAAAHPRLYEAFRSLATESASLMVGTPRQKDKGLFVRNAVDFQRPEVKMAKSRLAGAKRRGARRAEIVTSDVENHRTPTQGKKGVDSFRLHPVFGAYPAELEFVYPFTQTVTSEEEALRVKALGVAKRQLKAMGYSRVTVAEKGRPKSRRRPKGASLSPRSVSSRPR